MTNKSGIKLDIDFREISAGNYTSRKDELTINNKMNFITRITFILPSYQEYPVGTFFLNEAAYQIGLMIRKISNFQDTVLIELKNSGVNVAGSSFPMLPVSAYTDNRGKYPCYQANIELPYLLLDEQIQLSDIELSGENPHIKKIKITALKILSNFFSEYKSDVKINRVEYDDVTALFIGYYDKKTGSIVGKEVFALTSKDAFKNAVFDYYLGDDIKNSIREHSEKIKTNLIKSEEDLYKVIVEAIQKIIHYVEDKRLNQPFWNETEPKKETDIQPTIDAFFGMLLEGKGIHTIKEADEGIGSLDFKFLYTTIEQIGICLCLEFKLAHHKKIEQGLTKQLPAYLKANRSTYGIFFVMWFKDKERKFFSEPIEFEKSELLALLNKDADEVKNTLGLIIKPIIVDASKKPSASHLK